ncbi:hypothetical protein Vadar_028092 [Vaccinium darrowii]|uniref:Uncharacterized protein n=1 Tax=Vaccinium darrowii TaxID=229202 RepID=A0ACB7Z7P1_9ERIC|nr:hypothetical protein Vadar_028092 [Vaccinium darrowii]
MGSLPIVTARALSTAEMMKPIRILMDNFLLDNFTDKLENRMAIATKMKVLENSKLQTNLSIDQPIRQHKSLTVVPKIMFLLFFINCVWNITCFCDHLPKFSQFRINLPSPRVGPVSNAE